MPFTLQPGKEPSPNSHPRKPQAYIQALTLQQAVYEAAQTKDKPIPPRDLAALVKAWSDLEETKRKLRMKPLPKPIDVSQRNKDKAPKHGPSFSE